MLIHSQTNYYEFNQNRPIRELAKVTIHQYSPQKRTITVRMPGNETKKYFLQFPYLTFVRGDDSLGVNEIYVFASAEKIEDYSNPVIFLPMLNVGSTGMICLGERNGSAIHHSIEECVDTFWLSIFNNDICSGFKKHIKCLMDEKGGYLHFNSYEINDMDKVVLDGIFQHWQNTTYLDTISSDKDKFFHLKTTIYPFGKYLGPFYQVDNLVPKNEKQENFLRFINLSDKEQLCMERNINQIRISNNKTTLHSLDQILRLANTEEFNLAFDQLEIQQNI